MAMRIHHSVELRVVQAHEQITQANVRLGGYHMDKTCLLNDFKSWRACLESNDISRLFLLYDYAKYTKRNTCRITDLLSDASSIPKVASLIGDKFQLRENVALAILLVSVDAQRGPW